jgi:hypothetical protein
MHSTEVCEHPQAHALGAPPSREPTHTGTSPYKERFNAIFRAVSILKIQGKIKLVIWEYLSFTLL